MPQLASSLPEPKASLYSLKNASEFAENPLLVWRALGRTRQPTHEFALPRICDLTVAGERRHHLLVPEVLAPRFELFGRSADLLAQLGKRVAERMRIGIGEAGADERLLEDFPDRRRVRPA